MTRVIRVGLIQASLGGDVPTELERLKTHMIEKHLALIDDAANRGVEILCLQERSTALTSAPNKTGLSMPWPRKFPKARRFG